MTASKSRLSRIPISKIANSHWVNVGRYRQKYRKQGVTKKSICAEEERRIQSPLNVCRLWNCWKSLQLDPNIGQIMDVTLWEAKEKSGLVY